MYSANFQVYVQYERETLNNQEINTHSIGDKVCYVPRSILSV